MRDQRSEESMVIPLTVCGSPTQNIRKYHPEWPSGGVGFAPEERGAMASSPESDTGGLALSLRGFAIP